MYKLLFAVLMCVALGGKSQALHESFKQDAELHSAFVKLDMTAFMSDPVNFIYDTLDRTVQTPASLNALMKQNILFPKNTTVKKASETNNGYVQTFGIYNKNDDAIMFVRFTLNAESGKLEEVVVEKNN